MKVVFGTTNQAKLESIRRITRYINIEIIGLHELNQPLPIIDESGSNPLENAEMKAKAYYNAFHLPVFSCDSGLFFNNLDESLQPGTQVRRINGKNLTDEEMIEYYSNLSRQHNGQYYYDLHNKTVDKSSIENGFKDFFIKTLANFKNTH